MKKKLGLLLVVVLILGISVLPGCSREAKPPVGEPPVEEPPVEEPPVEEPNIVRLVDPVVVVINNHAAARPQSGLQEASIVYEYFAEGGITRLLAVFDKLSDENVVIGPIRSLRPYFAVQAVEYGGVVAHSGMSQRTRELIKGLGLKQLTSSTTLWRDSSRNAPHNLYTDLEKLYKARGKSDVDAKVVERAELPEGFEEGKEIEVMGHNVSYTYDEERDVYLRFVKGKAHKDRESKKQYYARRVILRANKHRDVPGSDLLEIDLEGAGEALLYESGRMYKIRWEKTGGKTGYYFPDGTPVSLEEGNTWVQVIRE